jgi:hypothetical protein
MFLSLKFAVFYNSSPDSEAVCMQCVDILASENGRKMTKCALDPSQSIARPVFQLVVNSFFLRICGSETF